MANSYIKVSTGLTLKLGNCILVFFPSTVNASLLLIFLAVGKLLHLGISTYMCLWCGPTGQIQFLLKFIASFSLHQK